MDHFLYIFLFFSFFLHTLLRDGRADVQVGRLVFDVLRQGEDVIQLGVTLLQVVLCCLAAGGAHAREHTKANARQIRSGPPIFYL